MKTFVAIVSFALALAFNLSSALTAEFPIVASGDESLVERTVNAVRYTNSLGQVAQAWKEVEIYQRYVHVVNMHGVVYPEPKRRLTIKITDGKGGVFDERLFMNPVGPLVQLPEPPPVVVVNTCYDRSYSPYYWGGGGGMYNSGGMWNPAGGGYTGDMGQAGESENAGGFNSLDGMRASGASFRAGGQFTSGLAQQPGRSGTASITWVNDGMQVGVGSANYGRNSAGESFLGGGAEAGAILTVGEPRREVHVVPTTPGSRRTVYSSMPVPDHRRRK
jgi:hypothetical protein